MCISDNNINDSDTEVDEESAIFNEKSFHKHNNDSSKMKTNSTHHHKIKTTEP